MMQSLGGDDEVREETEYEQLRRRIADLELQFSAHLHNVNNPHATDYRQAGAFSRSQMRRHFEGLVKYHSDAARATIGMVMFCMLFFVGATIHFWSEPTRDWVMCALSALGTIMPYHYLSRRTDHHRGLADQYQREADSLK